MAEERGARLVLLGTPYLVSAIGRIDLPETAPAYLGLFLAVQPGWAPRERVAAYLWPDATTERAQHNLRVALNRLGALVQQWGLQDALQAERRRVRLTLNSDLADFRAHVARGDWMQACSLPNGSFLDGVQFTSYPTLMEWLSVEREAQRRSWRKALLEAAAVGAPIDEPLARYVAAHPTDGEAASLQAARLAAGGHALQAQEVIASFKRASADELSADELDEQLRKIEHSVAVLTPSLPAAEHGGLLGRMAELAGLEAASQEHRWVTVTGLAGAGKSSLVLAWLARREASQPAERATRIDINERSKASAVADAIVTALAPEPAPRAAASGPATWLARLAPLKGLVVFDGLDPQSADEELLALLRGVAEGCPTLRVLATSRRPLGVVGEHVHRLRGLSAQRGSEGSLSEAAQLFLREAQRMRPNHRWADLSEEAERIARLCEGLPLALKLAASWSRWVEPGRLAGELERSARDTAGAIDRALHAWLEAPWQRLTRPQQQALSSLSLFPGSFDMQSAAAAAAASASEIETLLASCLIESEPGTPQRLHLHPLVREFAAARLNDAPAQRRAAASRYLAVVDVLLGPRSTERGQAIFTPAQVSGCIEDALAAWPLALETGALAEVQWLAEALLAWHESMGEYRAGAQQLAVAEEACDEEIPGEAAVLARIQVARATLLYRAGDYDAAGALAREAQRLGEVTGQRRVARRAINTLGLSYWMRLSLDEAKAMFEQGLASAIEDGEDREEARFSTNLGLVEKSRGDYSAAESAWRRAIELDQLLGAWDGACTCLNNLANLLRHSRRFVECEVLALECLRLTHEHGLETQRPFALIGLALLHYATGRLDQAEQYLNLLDACREDSVEGAVSAGASQLRAQIALDRGDGGTALQQIAAALRICVRNDDAANRAESLMLYGQWLAQHGGRRDEALRLWAALSGASAVHATLKDELRKRLVEHHHEAPAEPAAEVDLALVVEQALAAARHFGAGQVPR